MGKDPPDKPPKGIVRATQVVSDGNEGIEVEEARGQSLLQQREEAALKRRGAKTLASKKPKGAARYLVDAPIRTSRPVNVYKELVTDSTTGESGLFVWYTTEDSKTIGKEEIVRINPRTEEAFTLGYDFTIPYNEKVRAELLQLKFGRTTFINKDGAVRYVIKDPAKEF